MKHAIWIATLLAAGILVITAQQPVVSTIPAATADDRLARHRNLGKAFYENPTTQAESVEEFRQALLLSPDSPRERINYGLSLLRAGKTDLGVAELEKVQKTHPSLPHTWFNLGIIFKKAGDNARAIAQFQQMIVLDPDEPISHYNLGALYKAEGKPEDAIKELQIAARLRPELAAAHFQLFNTYRQIKQAADSARELEIFQRLKKQQEGAAIPEDVDWSDYAEVYDPAEAHVISDPPETSKYQQRKLAVQLDPATAGLALIDYDNDGRTDLLAWSSKGVHILKNGSEAVKSTGLEGVSEIVSVAPADYNNDGWMDLCILTASGPKLFLNDKGHFRPDPAPLAAFKDKKWPKYVKAAWIDYDHDYDLDLVLLGAQPMLLRNQGESGFQDHTADFPFQDGTPIDAQVFRTVADSKGIDLVTSYEDHQGVVYEDKLSGHFEPLVLGFLPTGSKSLQAVDWNSDGAIDLVYLGADGIGLLTNRAGKLLRTDLTERYAGFVFADLDSRGAMDLVTSSKLFRVGAGRFRVEDPISSDAMIWTSADFTGTGRLDLISVGKDGFLYSFVRQTASRNQWLSVRLNGVKNLQLAQGAEVEVKAGTHYQKQTYQGVPLLFGLGAERLADTVRITWPNGLIQNEVRQAAGKMYVYKEAQRLSGSCPVIWTWNGRGFEYITDVLGVAPLGASSGDGKYFAVDHDEYIQIPGRSLVPKDGAFEIRISEELSEVAFLDQVRLIAVDHPSSIDIFTNEKFKGPPFPEFRLFGATERIYPRSAKDGQGRNVLPALLHRDKIYPDTFTHNFSGVAEMHSLDLDFGPQAAAGNRSVLILNGWVDWADGSTFMGKSQETKQGLVMPYLQVKNDKGEWQTVLEDMGMPAGKPKTIAIDLTGKFLSASREVRIVTSLCVFWDEIFLSNDSAPPQATLSPLDASRAVVHFRGFSPSHIHPQRKQPEYFSYENATPTSLWNPTPGNYTRYGDVTPLVQEPDDRFVVMGSGDELQLHFDASALPALRPGWTRDYLLKVDGWAKDRDANTAFSQSVDPLPFHAMKQYPYGAAEHFPADAEHEAYRREYNTRPALRLIRPLSTAVRQVPDRNADRRQSQPDHYGN